MIQDGLELCLRRLGSDIEIAKLPDLTDLSAVEDTVPDLVLCDIETPDEPPEAGLSALRAVHSRLPNTAIIVFTAVRDSHSVSGALEAGARGYIPKTYDGESILNGVRLVLAGGIYVPPALFQPVEALTPGSTASSAEVRRTPRLTPRQRDVLMLLSRGYSNRQIGLELGIAEGTIKIHVAALFRAFGVSNRTQAVIEASGHGLLGHNGSRPRPESSGRRGGQDQS